MKRHLRTMFMGILQTKRFSNTKILFQIEREWI